MGTGPFRGHWIYHASNTLEVFIIHYCFESLLILKVNTNSMEKFSACHKLHTLKEAIPYQNYQSIKFWEFDGTHSERLSWTLCDPTSHEIDVLHTYRDIKMQFVPNFTRFVGMQTIWIPNSAWLQESSLISTVQELVYVFEYNRKQC